MHQPPGSPIILAYLAFTLWGLALGTVFGLLLGWLLF
mgnify:CR=1 FL=1